MQLTSSTFNPILLAATVKPTLAREPQPAVNGETVAQIAARAGSGSIEAFEELALRFEPRIYGFLWRHVGNAHDAQDLTQETFVRAWRGIHRFDPQRDFTTWLFVIARRSAANHFRARRFHDELSDELADPATRPMDAAVSADDSTHLWRFAKKLKPAYYEALWLRYGEDFSVAQTARVMGLTTIHVKVILHRARKDLARHLKPRRL